MNSLFLTPLRGAHILIVARETSQARVAYMTQE
jgi:hypothetical protein